MSFAERMGQRRKELGLSRMELATRLGVSASAISNYENGFSAPKEEILLRMFDVLETEPNFLFQDSFTAKSDTLSSNELKLIARYRALTAKGKLAVSSLLDAMEEKHESRTVAFPAPPARQIPLFASAAAAGYAAPILGEEYEMMDADEAPAAAQFAIRISGDSMEPHIKDGSIVYVGREPLADGDIGIFCVDGDAFCKQYHKDALGMVYLLSLNRKREDADVLLPPSSGRMLACFGKVLMREHFPLPDSVR